LINPENYLTGSSTSPPTVNKSNQPIVYAPPSENPHIGYGAPTLENILAGRKHRATSTKTTTHKVLAQGSSSQPTQPSAITSSAQVADLPIVEVPDSPPAGN
jgi:hypothetical protein